MFYALISILFASIGQIALKYSLKSLALTNVSFNFKFITDVFLNWKIIASLSLYGFSAVLWVFSLSNFNLSYLYPLTGLTFILITLFSYLILKEPILSTQIIGIFLILAGIKLTLKI